LGQLAAFLDKEGYSLQANRVRQAEHEEQAALSQLEEIIYNRMLTGLLGSQYTAKIKQTILDKRLESVAFDMKRIRDVLTAAYSVPCKIEGRGADDTHAILEMINEEAIAILGKPLFKWDDMGRVLYLGLWGR
jgi:hypothetical protein